MAINSPSPHTANTPVVSTTSVSTSCACEGRLSQLENRIDTLTKHIDRIHGSHQLQATESNLELKTLQYQLQFERKQSNYFEAQSEKLLSLLTSTSQLLNQKPVPVQETQLSAVTPDVTSVTPETTNQSQVSPATKYGHDTTMHTVNYYLCQGPQDSLSNFYQCKMEIVI